MILKKMIALGLILIIAISGCVFNPDTKNQDQKNVVIKQEFGNYWINIQRNYSDAGERKAIEIAENNINYENYTNMPRFHGQRANYIDSSVIEYYNESFFSAKKTNKADVSYDYSANAKFYPALSNSNFSASTNYIIFKINGTESSRLNSYNTTLKNVYLVDMLLRYMEVEGPYAGYSISTHQIIIMDEDYNLKLIVLEPWSIVVY